MTTHSNESMNSSGKVQKLWRTSLQQHGYWHGNESIQGWEVLSSVLTECLSLLPISAKQLNLKVRIYKTLFFSDFIDPIKNMASSIVCNSCLIMFDGMIWCKILAKKLTSLLKCAGKVRKAQLVSMFSATRIAKPKVTPRPRIEESTSSTFRSFSWMYQCCSQGWYE